MRHKGSVSQINIARDRFIVNVAYRNAKRLVSYPTKTMHICEIAANIEAPEFYISSDTAIYYVRDRYYHNKCKTFDNRYKQRLFDALYQRFLQLVERPENKKRSIPAIVLRALSSPAPCAGLSPLQVYYTILRHRSNHHRH